MQIRKFYRSMLPVYLLVLLAFLYSAQLISYSATTMAESMPIEHRTCFIIDAGHGGVDGGATSCSGILESKYNLDIALRLNDLMHLLGLKTQMIRTDDISVYTEGETIAAKKVSDLKERVRIVNSTEGAVLISLHMNYFPDSRYYGPQVFYCSKSSEVLAEQMQRALKTNLAPSSGRQVKKASGIYLLQNINKPGILIECGFISNPEEDFRLRDIYYQKKLCCVIGTQALHFLANT